MKPMDHALLREVALSILLRPQAGTHALLPQAHKPACAPVVIDGGPLHHSVLLSCDGHPLAVTNGFLNPL